MKHSEPYHISVDVERLVSTLDSACNPNSIVKNQNGEHRNGRRALANDFQKRVEQKEMAAWSKRGKACIGPPKTPAERAQGIRTFQQPSSLTSCPSLEEPINPQGIRLKSKKRVYGPRQELFSTLQSQSYDQSALYGSIKTFSGEQQKTFSHQSILFPTQKSLNTESVKGFSHMRNCDEWEQKVLTTLLRSGSPESPFQTNGRNIASPRFRADNLHQNAGVPRARSMSPIQRHTPSKNMSDFSNTYPKQNQDQQSRNTSYSPFQQNMHRRSPMRSRDDQSAFRKNSARDVQIEQLQKEIGKLKTQRYITKKKPI